MMVLVMLYADATHGASRLPWELLADTVQDTLAKHSSNDIVFTDSTLSNRGTLSDSNSLMQSTLMALLYEVEL